MNPELVALFRDATNAGYTLGINATKAHIGRNDAPGVYIWLDDGVAVQDNLPMHKWQAMHSIKEIRRFLKLNTRRTT